MLEELKNLELLTPLFTILGVMLGAIMTFLTSKYLKTRETQLKISSQLIEKRIEAHEKVLSLAKSMRSTVSLDKVDAQQMFITYPMIFENQERFRDWRNTFFIISNEHSHWLGQLVSRELMLIQDYIINLDRRLERVPDQNYRAVGVLLKKDFTDLASQLEKSVLKYFDKGWKSLKIDVDVNHKLSNRISKKRIDETNLMKRHLELNRYFDKENKVIPRSDVKKYTELYNLAPNGLKLDAIKIREVPNVDKSGVEYELTYKDSEDWGKPRKFGHCDLIMGNIMFDAVDSEAQTLGVNFEAVKLLTKWIEENLEESGFD